MKEFCKPNLDVCVTVKKQAVKRVGGKKNNIKTSPLASANKPFCQWLNRNLFKIT